MRRVVALQPKLNIAHGITCMATPRARLAFSASATSHVAMPSEIPCVHDQLLGLVVLYTRSLELSELCPALGLPEMLPFSYTGTQHAVPRIACQLTCPGR